MKKSSAAMMMTLATLTALSAGSVMADTSTTTVSATAPKLIDKIIASYWGYYSGPAVTNPTRMTLTNDTGDLDDTQGLDSTFTLGYRLSKDISVSANYRNILTPMENTPDGDLDLTTKDAWIALRHGKLINGISGLNLSADLRAFIPIQTAGRMFTGLRSTQTLTYEIPKSRLTIGTFTIARGNWARGAQARAVDNINLSLSTLANYQLTPNLAITGWSDILTYDIKFGRDVSNKQIPVSLGVNWDINSNISFNPQLTAFPATARLNNTTIGAILSARLL